MNKDDLNTLLDGAEQFALSLMMLKRILIEQQQRLLIMNISSEADEKALITLKHQLIGMASLINLYEKEYNKARKAVHSMP